MRSRAERLLVLLAHLGQKLFRVRALHPLDIRFPPDPWLAAARASVMLPMEEFSCQSSMEHTCVQYCSITVNGGGNERVGSAELSMVGRGYSTALDYPDHPPRLSRILALGER
jgi:hypothetical protein